MQADPLEESGELGVEHLRVQAKKWGRAEPI
jgi:hypothetical protein